jgi:LPS O-antigen subunit length determinant protein (WzzB/FepE family)
MLVNTPNGSTSVGSDEYFRVNTLLSSRIEVFGKMLRRGRFTLLCFIGLFAVAGVIYSYLQPIQYTAEVRLMPEIQGKAAGSFKQFGALASLVGIDLGSTSSVEAVRPDLYPDVLQGTPFVLQLLQQPMRTKEGSQAALYLLLQQPSFFDKITGSDTIRIPRLSAKNELISLDKKQKLFVEATRKQITAILDKRSGIISVAVTMPDPLMAAMVTQYSVDYLRNYVTSYRTEKTRVDVKFLYGRVAEAKRRYEQSQVAWATYQDQHRYLVMRQADIEGRRLEAEFLFMQSLYNDIHRQLEQAKIRVQEETPVFKVLEPAQIPATRSAPKRTLIVVGFIITGTLLGLLFLIVSDRVKKVRALTV